MMDIDIIFGSSLPVYFTAQIRVVDYFLSPQYSYTSSNIAAQRSLISAARILRSSTTVLTWRYGTGYPSLIYNQTHVFLGDNTHLLIELYIRTELNILLAPGRSRVVPYPTCE